MRPGGCVQPADDSRNRTIRTDKAWGANRSSFGEGNVPLAGFESTPQLSLRLAVTLPADPDRGPLIPWGPAVLH